MSGATRQPAADILVLALCAVLLQPAATVAGESDGEVGTSATSVMRLGIGARPSALGHAYAAVDGDASALFINPAGIATIAFAELDLHHQRRFFDTSVSSFAAAIPAGPLVVGFGTGYFDHGTINEVVNFETTSNRLGSSDLDLMAGVGAPLGSYLTVGGRLDLRRSVLADDFDDTGVAVGLGVQAIDIYDRLGLGLAIENLGGEQQLSETNRSDPLPSTVRGGLALDLLATDAGATGAALLAVGDMWKSRGSRAQWGVGAELAWRRISRSPVGLAGRFGYRSGGAAADELRNWTAGVGIDLGGLAFDYAFEDFGMLGDVHRFSLSFRRQPSPAPIVMAPLDADRDGVDDGLDRCPGTPIGALVDASGCPLDGDADGVPDGIDQCPGTPPGAWVGRAGCPLDSDFDGVFDGIDRCPETQPGRRVDVVGCPVPLPLLRFEAVQFGFDDYGLADPDLPRLNEIGEAMRRWPELRIRVAGHADAVGSAQYNQALSERRAQIAAQHLLERFPDIHAERIEVTGFGEKVPIAPNDTEEGRQLNRRVQIVPLNGETIENSELESDR